MSYSESSNCNKKPRFAFCRKVHVDGKIDIDIPDKDLQQDIKLNYEIRLQSVEFPGCYEKNISGCVIHEGCVRVPLKCKIACPKKIEVPVKSSLLVVGHRPNVCQ